MAPATASPVKGKQADPSAADAEPQSSEKPKKTNKKPPTLASALSGAISGSLISACVQPLDVVRTKMQADAARGLVRSTMATATVVLREQGVRGFWAGTGPSVIRVGLGAGLHFVLLEQIRAAVSTTAPDGAQQLSNMGAAMAGGLSRAVAAILLCPVTVVKTRMEYVADVGAAAGPAAAAAGGAAAGAGAGAAAASRAAAASAASGAAAAAAGAAAGAAGAVPVYRDTGHALASILRTEGVRGLFRGVWPTVLTNAPYSGLYYMMYTRMKENLTAEGRPQAAVNFASGVVAAVAATLLTQPADVVRTRMQLGLGTAAGAAAGAAGGAWGTLGLALKQQGPAALLTGAAPRVLKRTTQTALVWTLYEELVPRITALGYAAKESWEQRAGAAGAGAGAGAGGAAGAEGAGGQRGAGGR
ncbi:hypothetical protein HYH03_004559 [Edaphochlamys debaryana]|uniref:Mitochondrial carrier protein n=1 Tax=Edaphochlamys debaryana TaxID=47281 RepID=A0A835YGX9_9CHLO|nr:hypothetical protein HYH03_004559 [Edaphochlamys debaryana]|eukprot:KAG2497404.1 hypothetical protein HYH03_004559 [Edaphochlamys debaryana]